VLIPTPKPIQQLVAKGIVVDDLTSHQTARGCCRVERRWKLSLVEIDSNPDNDAHRLTIGQSCTLNQDATDLSATDQEIIRPFYINIGARFPESAGWTEEY
jgi:hypothetical protein